MDWPCACQRHADVNDIQIAANPAQNTRGSSWHRSDCNYYTNVGRAGQGNFAANRKQAVVSTKSASPSKNGHKERGAQLLGEQQKLRFEISIWVDSRRAAGARTRSGD
jgi:hypothetical protein